MRVCGTLLLCLANTGAEEPVIQRYGSLFSESAVLVDHAALAEAAGFRAVHRFTDARAWAAAVPELLSSPGPTFVHAVVQPGSQGPIGRNEQEHARYLRHSLAEWSAIMRGALTTV